jgi:hypothetical protein
MVINRQPDQDGRLIGFDGVGWFSGSRCGHVGSGTDGIVMADGSVLLGGLNSIAQHFLLPVVPNSSPRQDRRRRLVVFVCVCKAFFRAVKNTNKDKFRIVAAPRNRRNFSVDLWITRCQNYYQWAGPRAFFVRAALGQSGRRLDK